jgi:predicted Zn-dependent protease
MAEAALVGGEAFYFDGAGARRRTVHVALESEGVAIAEAGARLAFWRYADLRPADSPGGMLRLAAAGAPELARLEIRDPALIQAIGFRVPGLEKQGARDRAGTSRIVVWSLTAAVSLVLTVVFLVPLVADRLAPIVPLAMERRLGEAVDSQVRAMFGAETCAKEPGAAALAELSGRLTDAADLAIPVDIAVLRSKIPNAVALPGGYVYVFEGLLTEARGPDELAGVIGHELGHVAGRDGLRRLIQAGGSSFLLGMLFGDITGGGALIFAARTLVDSRYSREAETGADAFAKSLMFRVGRSSKPLGEFLVRIDAGGDGGLAFLSSHPVTAERVKSLEDQDRPPAGAPLLDDGEWRALKAICG